MRIPSRRKKIAFFLILGICLVAAAVALTVVWLVLNWREGVLLFFGIVFFMAIITGLILNTIFLVREIRLNEQHDSFINAVTHEIKTPIASIRLYLETLQRREIDAAQRQEFYKLMLQDTERLTGTVEQVLKAAEARYKRGERHNVEIDFGNLVGECAELARTRHHLGNGAVQVSVSNSGQSTTLQGDPEELRTAVSNLLDNAIKYSAGNVDVMAQVLTDADGRVVLRVRDKGMGIPPDELKRIFRRFYRVRSRSRGKVKGTGLGLFIVQSVAKAHGGRVYAESEGEGKGTTVTLELPGRAA